MKHTLKTTIKLCRPYFFKYAMYRGHTYMVLTRGRKGELTDLMGSVDVVRGKEEKEFENLYVLLLVSIFFHLKDVRTKVNGSIILWWPFHHQSIELSFLDCSPPSLGRNLPYSGNFLE